jgi:DNA helicase-2/ATP-dependent DNA helicase PcrA
MSIKERRLRALEEERRLTYVAITRAEKRLYITESEGFNYIIGDNKYPSRFLFEIKENMLIHKGKIDPLYLHEAKNHFLFEKLKIEENNTTFALGDVVLHPVWKDGEIINIDYSKGEYEIKFKDNKIRPINFEYKSLVLVNKLLRIKEVKDSQDLHLQPTINSITKDVTLLNQNYNDEKIIGSDNFESNNLVNQIEQNKIDFIISSKPETKITSTVDPSIDLENSIIEDHNSYSDKSMINEFLETNKSTITKDKIIDSPEIKSEDLSEKKNGFWSILSKFIK